MTFYYDNISDIPPHLVDAIKSNFPGHNLCVFVATESTLQGRRVVVGVVTPDNHPYGGYAHSINAFVSGYIAGWNSGVNTEPVKDDKAGEQSRADDKDRYDRLLQLANTPEHLRVGSVHVNTETAEGMSIAMVLKYRNNCLSILRLSPNDDGNYYNLLAVNKEIAKALGFEY
ncbi:MAG: hypothetical protein H6550_16225 [Chitinophagales bacterium]|nr:hypothetical protein [Chitinophagales bacterium]